MTPTSSFNRRKQGATQGHITDRVTLPSCVTAKEDWDLNRRTPAAHYNSHYRRVLVLVSSLDLPKSDWQACQTTHREPGLKVAA